MITKLAGYYSIGGNPVIVDDGLAVSFSDDKELIVYATEAEFLEAFPEPELEPEPEELEPELEPEPEPEELEEGDE